jgi:molecular chaperone GrpE
MSNSNVQADVNINEESKQSHESELPPADPADGFVEKEPSEKAAQAQAVAQPQTADELQKVRAERDSLFDRLARLQAEFENYRKRAAKENIDFREHALADAAKSLLPVIDNFSLALKNAVLNPDEFRKGVELIHKQLQDALQRMNVQRIAAQGQPFDPRLHEAIEMVESDDVPDHHVLEELQPGYKIKDRLLRPAMVRVAQNTRKVD